MVRITLIFSPIETMPFAFHLRLARTLVFTALPEADVCVYVYFTPIEAHTVRSAELAYSLNFWV